MNSGARSSGLAPDFFERLEVNLRELSREPLVHFLAIGLGLFLLYALVAPANRDDDRIVISAAKVTDLARQYQATWNRAPTPAELQGLIDAEVNSKILYREGVALGLDRDDAIIERRVRQKYELMSEEENAGDPPSEAELTAYLAANPEKFRQPAVVSFDQILFEVKGSDAEIEARIDAARKAALGGADPASLGDATMLPRGVQSLALDLVARDFGEKFATAIAQAPIGQWGPPILSGYGIHLVRVSECRQAAPPQLAEVRAEVVREWENDRRIKASEASYARARARYDVVIEGQP